MFENEVSVKEKAVKAQVFLKFHAVASDLHKFAERIRNCNPSMMPSELLEDLIRQLEEEMSYIQLHALKIELNPEKVPGIGLLEKIIDSMKEDQERYLSPSEFFQRAGDFEEVASALGHAIGKIKPLQNDSCATFD